MVASPIPVAWEMLCKPCFILQQGKDLCVKKERKGLPVPNFAKAAISTSTFLMKG
jgi:hypothetical protein